MTPEQWQATGILLSAATVTAGILLNHYYRVSKAKTEIETRLTILEVEVKQLQSNELKTETKFNQIMDKLEKILVGMENKQDKDY